MLYIYICELIELKMINLKKSHLTCYSFFSLTFYTYTFNLIRKNMAAGEMSFSLNLQNLIPEKYLKWVLLAKISSRRKNSFDVANIY